MESEIIENAFKDWTNSTIFNWTIRNTKKWNGSFNVQDKAHNIEINLIDDLIYEVRVLSKIYSLYIQINSLYLIENILLEFLEMKPNCLIFDFVEQSNILSKEFYALSKKLININKEYKIGTIGKNEKIAYFLYHKNFDTKIISTVFELAE